MITITTVQQPHEASIIQALLKQANIECCILNEYSSQLYNSAFDAITIQVLEEDAEKAQAVLREEGFEL